MKAIRTTLCLTVLLTASLAGAFPDGKKGSAGPAAPAAAAPASAVLGKGKVVETMNTSGYTYVNVDVGGGKKIWAAAPEFKVKKGSVVTVPQGLPMSNYHSKSLNRTFDTVYFVGSVTVDKK